MNAHKARHIRLSLYNIMNTCSPRSRSKNTLKNTNCFVRYFLHV
ncbi:hypothetical protein [Brochothrix phage ADU4]|nr:hypothetical protein [Brochothrix phage ADU4]